MATLMSFVLNTLQPRLNNPDNDKLWAPKLLSNAKDKNNNPLLPLTSASDDLGEVTGDEASVLAEMLAHDWTFVKHIPDGEFGIANPTNPYPYVSMNNIELMGVQNLKIVAVQSQPTADGYSMILTAVFDAYPSDTTVNGVPMTDLYLQGKWRASQSVCSAKCADSTTCDGKFYDDMVGTGTFKMVFTGAGALIDATIGISGSGTQRTSVANITSVQIVGPSLTVGGAMPSYELPVVTLDQKLGSPGYTEATVNAFREALESSDAQPLVFQELNDLLAAPDTLASMTKTVQALIDNMLDDGFGAVPGNGLPDDAGNQQAATPVDLYVFDRVRLGVGNPKSHIYAPLLVDMNSDPVLEPWKKDKIVIPTQTIANLPWDITLTDVVVSGISNISFPIAQAILQSSAIQSEIQIGTLPAGPYQNVDQGGSTVNMQVPVPPPFALTCDFSAVLDNDPPPTFGNLTLDITGLVGQVDFQMAGADINSFSMTVTALSLDTTNAKATASVQTNPTDGPTEALLKKLFESANGMKAVTQQVNDQLTGQLGSISQSLTGTLRKTLQEMLGP